MVTCPRCGAESDGLKPYCINCGAPLPVENAGQHPPVYAAPEPGPRPFDERPAKGTRFAPMSIGSYIGTFLLLMLPVVNLILLIVWACGGCRNENKRNLARAMLILYAVCVILAIVLVVLLGVMNQVTDIVSSPQVSAVFALL